jgi:hypothetical protein
MNWESIGALGEVVGATAVLITLIYVAFQLKQTNDISRFDATKDIVNSFDSLNRIIVTDSSLRQVLQKNTELSQEENEQMYAFVNLFCNTWLMCQSAYDSRLIKRDFFLAATGDVPLALERWPSFRPFVVLWLDRFPHFKEYEIFSLLKQNG